MPNYLNLLRGITLTLFACSLRRVSDAYRLFSHSCGAGAFYVLLDR